MSEVFLDLSNKLVQIENNLIYLQSSKCNAFHHILDKSNPFYHRLHIANALLKYIRDGKRSLAPEEIKELERYHIIITTNNIRENYFFDLEDLINENVDELIEYREECDRIINAGRKIFTTLRDYHYSHHGRPFRAAQYRAERPEIYSQLAKSGNLP